MHDYPNRYPVATPYDNVIARLKELCRRREHAIQIGDEIYAFELDALVAEQLDTLWNLTRPAE
jgi:hypothetical protein